MDNFEELVRLNHKITRKNENDFNTQNGLIEEIKLKLSKQEELNQENKKNKEFFDMLNTLDCFECKNNIIKFKNKFNFNENEIKVLFDAVIDMFKYFRQEKYNMVKTQFSFLKKFVKENTDGLEKEF